MWDSCKLSYRYRYIDKIPGHGNWFSSFGTFAHLILELVDRGKIRPEDAYKVWVSHYGKRVLSQHPHSFPWMLKWYDGVSDFFFSFKGWRTKATHIEHYIEVDRGSYILRGYIDRGSIDSDGRVILTDHKSSNPFTKEDLAKKRRQLYLYSAHIKEETGNFPSKLIFNFFRKGEFITIPFNESEYNEAWAWADATVAEIEKAIADTDTEYPASPSPFFCQNICDFRATCPHTGR
jgi:hypothetical protein